MQRGASTQRLEADSPARTVGRELSDVVKVAASWSPQNYFNACKTPVASRSPRALRPVYASSECEAVEPASASIRCQDETQPI